MTSVNRITPSNNFQALRCREFGASMLYTPTGTCRTGPRYCWGLQLDRNKAYANNNQEGCHD